MELELETNFVPAGDYFYASPEITFESLRFTKSSPWRLINNSHRHILPKTKGTIQEENITINLNFQKSFVVFEHPDFWRNVMNNTALEAWNEIKKKLSNQMDSWFDNLVFRLFSSVTGVIFTDQ